jgi:FAD/FMN-containing dehydrogenase
VAEAIALAESRGLPLAVRSGGHCFAGRSSTEGVLIDVTPMDWVEVAGGVARIGAGARLGHVYDSLLEHGVTIPAGCGPTVGIAGLTLGGGLGIMGRTHGLTSDSLIAAEVVLADGRLIRCDHESSADLFWALRGAGAEGFGVVTSLEFATVPPPRATALRIEFAGSDAAALVAAWQEWSPDAPRELAASLLIVAEGDEPTVTVFGAMLGSMAETLELLDALVAAAGVTPTEEMFRHGAHREVKRWLAGEETADERRHSYSKSEFFRQPLPAESIEQLVAKLPEGRAPGERRELDFSPWSGAYNDPAPDSSAFVHRSERFLLKQATLVEPGPPGDWLRESWELVHPYGSGGVYPNFPDPELDDPGRAYYGSNLERVRAIQAEYGWPSQLLHPIDTTR